MTVAIVHYHLRNGGVTSVIIRASRALTQAGIQHVILVGEAPEEPQPDLPLRIIPELGYSVSPSSSSIAHLLRSAALRALENPPDVWHFHNHSLGKNPAVPAAVTELAASGERMVLQIHDLAEHGRPGGYRNLTTKSTLYPISPRIHYVFLNQRDHQAFRKAGLPAGNATMVANPLDLEMVPAQAPENTPPFLFAPIRGIRRKNLGELLLLSALAPQPCRFATSRAPRDPAALAIHNTWRKFADSRRLPIEFGVTDRIPPSPGAEPSFHSWIQHSTHVVSTSVEEGFGLPFLEAAAWRKPLIGRRLEIAEEFHDRGLYDRILVPNDWIERPVFKQMLTAALERDFRAYGRKLPPTHSAEIHHRLNADGWFDFGNLPEPLQQGVIERMDTPNGKRTPLVEIHGTREPAVDWLGGILSRRNPSGIDLQAYSPAAHLAALGRIYADLALQESAEPSFLSASRLLDEFLTPESFHFLLSSPPPKPRSAFPYRAVIFDIYGTILSAPAGGVRPDPAADSKLRGIIRRFGHQPPDSPSAEIHAAVARWHAAAGIPYPEVDLRTLWREVLGIEPGSETTTLVTAIEDAWHPARLIAGADAAIQGLSRIGVSLGVLSNAQCCTLPSLGGTADLFSPELTILSYQHGMAKPSPGLFQMMVDRLAGRGIRPHETLYIGNDPLHDILPAAAVGFHTALFTGHPDSHRPGDCSPDHVLRRWQDLLDLG